jgi:hypothetical protein
LNLGVEIELRPGEKDNLNSKYIEALAHAWNVIQDNDVFRGIMSAMPLQVTQNSKESGTQAPFDRNMYEQALNTQAKSYTVGINLFWINLQWSATPGVPLRVTAIEEMSKVTFRSPATTGQLVIHVAVTGPEFNPLDHVQNGEPSDLLEDWRRLILSTTCTFRCWPLPRSGIGMLSSNASLCPRLTRVCTGRPSSGCMKSLGS